MSLFKLCRISTETITCVTRDAPNVPIIQKTITQSGSLYKLENMQETSNQANGMSTKPQVEVKI